MSVLAAVAVQRAYQPLPAPGMCLTAEGAPGLKAMVLLVVARALALGKGRTKARGAGWKRVHKVCGVGRDSMRTLEVEGLLRA